MCGDGLDERKAYTCLQTEFLSYRRASPAEARVGIVGESCLGAGIMACLRPHHHVCRSVPLKGDQPCRFQSPTYQAFASPAPAIPSCQAGPSCCSPLEQKAHQFTLIAHHFDKHLIRISSIKPLLRRAGDPPPYKRE